MPKKSKKTDEVYVDLNNFIDTGKVSCKRDDIYAEESENQKFEVEIETGEILEAELLSVVEIDDKEYAVYSIPSDNKPDCVDILASYIEKDEEGYDTLVDIENPEDKAKISDFIRSMIYDK